MTSLIETQVRVLIIACRQPVEVMDDMVGGAIRAVERAGGDYGTLEAPGVLELPAAVALAYESAQRPMGISYEGFVVLGCAIKGRTRKFDLVTTEAYRGLTDLAIGRRLAIGNGVLAVDDLEQARGRADVDGGDAGGAAARDCLAMIAMKRKLLGRPG